MKRAQIWIIITLMSIALIGLISFQLFWINSALKINSQRFRSDVSESLQRVASKLELHHMADQFKNRIDINADSGIFIVRSSVGNIEETVRGKRKMRGIIRTTDNVDSLTIERSRIIIDGEDDFVLDEKSIPQDSLHTIRLNSRSEVVDLLITQLTDADFNFWVPSEKIVDSLLHRELDEKGINIAYTFAVVRHKPDTVLYANHPNAIEDYSNYEFQTSLNPNDLIGNLNFLAVNFPNQNQFLFKKIWLTLASSIILLLTIIFCFGYAVQTIIRQKKLSEIKNDFINNMTHEFKTPVATIALASEALREKEVYENEATLFRYLDIIYDENSRLGTQVEKVLQAASLDRSDYELNTDVLDLVQLLNQVRKHFAVKSEKLNGEIRLTFDVNTAQIKGDEHHLASSMNNLVDNAIKYSQGVPQVMIKLERVSNTFLIHVTDKGIGMSSESLRKVFDKFYRVPTGNLHDVKGFGLGLSYVDTIVRMHGGKVTATSTVGKGSTFTITLPVYEG